MANTNPRILFAAAFLVQSAVAEHGKVPVDVSKLPPAAGTPVEFARDIHPVLTKHCVKCHGEEKQKGGLRLDNKASAFKGGDDGLVLVAGKSAESRLIHLVAGLEPDTIMPPKDEKLTPEQIGILRAWIDQGAVWPDDGKVAKVKSDHWSLQPLKISDPSYNSVDAFISARLKKEGLASSPEAGRATLIRRLSFDLLGLPPAPEEVDAFVKDPSPKAYEALVDRLLESPRYGERWGRHWLDVARYTESQGFEYDQLRENAWHYRDYVIQCFNQDKPYDQFMREQVAGDVLQPMTGEGMIGPSLLVCGPWDQAGNAQSNATQKMITREDELEDLLGVVGQSFLGLTVNCARCHAHKFDPIPHEDYYRMKSVFEGVKHGERDVPDMESREKIQKRKELEDLITTASQKVKEIEASGTKLAQARKPAAPKPDAGPAAFARWMFDGKQSATVPGRTEGGAVMENGKLKLKQQGAYFQSDPLPKDIREKTLEAWVSLATLDQRGGAAISIEGGNGAVFDAIVFAEQQPKKWMAGSNSFARSQDLGGPEESAPPGTLVHMAAVYRADNTIAFYRNGAPLGRPYRKHALQTYKAGDAHILIGLRHHGAANGFLTGEVQQAALYDRALTDAEVMAAFRAGGGSTIVQEDMLAALTAEQRAARDAALVEIKKATESLNSIKPVNNGKSYVGVRVQPQPTHRLVRGEVTSPAEAVTPGALSAISTLASDFGLPADAPEAQRRLKFADWLTDPKNPLPARVMANRVWHLHFGQGIAATPNDLGVSGSPPSHPELLDWLAGKFIASGWSVKALHRIILNSATYRQSSAANKAALAKDADNTLLWRFAPRRLEAEAVRDAMLFVSGEINLTMGGPSFRPFTTSSYGATFYHLVDRAEPEFNRRTVYRMNVNSGKDPLLDAFDCPDPAVKAPRRGVTTTPLQALELMNNSFVLRQASQLASRAMKMTNNDIPGAIVAAYRLALGRVPTPDEVTRAAAAGDLTSVCWALLNSTEIVYVR